MGNFVSIIPARGRSNTIPNKNIRVMAGKPLIGYAIENMKCCENIDLIVVTTDDPDISLVAKQYGCYVIERPDELCGDHITLDEVILHAVNYLEDDGFSFENYLIIKPIAPLLRLETIQRAIEILGERSEVDSIVSVLPEERRLWYEEGEQWKNISINAGRVYREIGVIFAVRRRVITPESWLGSSVVGLILDERESLNINEWDDWHLAERELTPKLRVLFVANGDPKIGLGHVYRGIALWSAFASRCDFIFLTQQGATLGIELLNRQDVTVQVYDTTDDLLSIVSNIQPDIVINDILDTSIRYISSLKSKGIFVVNLEDLGDGSLEADIVINALYDDLYLKPTHYVGPEYECLRQEFLESPIKDISPDVNNILITFGGIDSRNSTLQVLKALEGTITDEMTITIILGLGYSYRDELNATLSSYSANVRVYNNVSRMSEHILNADLIFTSAGRTVLEVMAVGTPCVVIVQNARETRHSHANSRFGIMNLGMADDVTKEKITQSFKILVDDYSLRQEMRRRMLRVPVRDGYNRVKNLILNSYTSFLLRS
jgi:spore coat polysaccharide biosynthesis predicted glycosyltransferase SpsG/CMP-N-acetylneuraminic acid synthetase